MIHQSQTELAEEESFNPPSRESLAILHAIRLQTALACLQLPLSG